MSPEMIRSQVAGWVLTGARPWTEALAQAPLKLGNFPTRSLDSNKSMRKSTQGLIDIKVERRWWYVNKLGSWRVTIGSGKEKKSNHPINSKDLASSSLQVSFASFSPELEGERHGEKPSGSL